MQKKVRVYRIANKHDTGMYNTATQISSDVDLVKHPTPYKDSLMQKDFLRVINDGDVFYIPHQYRCGFKNIDQLRAWVYKDEWLQDLHAREFFLKIYEVAHNKVIFGYTQVMFEFESAELIADCHILEFFNLTKE